VPRTLGLVGVVVEVANMISTRLIWEWRSGWPRFVALSRLMGIAYHCLEGEVTSVRSWAFPPGGLRAELCEVSRGCGQCLKGHWSCECLGRQQWEGGPAGKALIGWGIMNCCGMGGEEKETWRRAAW